MIFLIEIVKLSTVNYEPPIYSFFTKFSIAHQSYDFNTKGLFVVHRIDKHREKYLPQVCKFNMRKVFFMSTNIKNNKRKIMTTDGKMIDYTEQRYVRKRSTSYYDYVQSKRRFSEFKMGALDELHQIVIDSENDENFDLNDRIEKSKFFHLTENIDDYIFNPDFYKSAEMRSKMENNYNTIKKSVVVIQKMNADVPRVEPMSATSTLGIMPLNDKVDDRVSATKFINYFFKYYKFLLNRKWDTMDKLDVEMKDKNTIYSLKCILSFDTEWKPVPDPKDKDNKLGVKIRRPEDIINISYSMFFPSYPNVKIHGVYFNVDHTPINFRQFLNAMIDRIQSEFNVPEKHLKLKQLKFLITGYFLGVDFSALTGWNKLNTYITVLNKQYIFTQQPFKINVKNQSQMRRLMELKKKNEQPRDDEDLNGIDCSITIRDSGLLAPQGGLEALGEVVDMEKIDTEEDDAKNGKPKGYYKTHMNEYLKDCPKRYYDYATRDAIIPLKFLQVVASTYQGVSLSEFEKFPMTTSNYAMKSVANALTTTETDQCIFNLNHSYSEIKVNPIAFVRDGYRDMYSLAQLSYFGGFNTAFSSGVFFGNVVDSDLSSAYNTAGNMMPVLNYNASFSNNLNDIGTKCITINQSTPFSVIYPYLKKLKGFPFVMGVGRASVHYPKKYDGIVTTPSLSPENNSPAYVKNLDGQPLQLMDMIDAFEHGANVMVTALYVPSQSYDKRNAWADGQQAFLSQRQNAKAKRDGNEEGSKAYKKYDAMQLLFKLAGNTIYGKSAQSVHPKRSRDWNTNETKEISISRITDPVIAGGYTAITRYLVHHLYDAVKKVYRDDVLPLNITTDGYTFMLPLGFKFDFDAVNEEFNSHLPQYYQERLKELGYKAGFERKGEKKDFDKPSRVFNTRTRFNGTFDIDCLEALGGVMTHTYDKYDIYRHLQLGHITLPVKYQKLSNLTEMKFGATNHMQGVLYDEPRYTRIPLQYDCAYKPDHWLSTKWNGWGFACVPFDTMKSHDEWKKHSKQLTDRYNIFRTRERFETYMKTMNSYSFWRTDLLDDVNYREKALYVKLKSEYPELPSERKYKDVLYKYKKAVNSSKKSSICLMAVYPNQKEDKK